MKGKIIIEYSYKKNIGKQKVDVICNQELISHAVEKAIEMWHDGYNQGELNYENNEGIFTGWWSITEK